MNAPTPSGTSNIWNPEDPESRRLRAMAGEDIGPRLLSELHLPETENQFWDRFVRSGILDPVEGIGQTGQVAQELPPEEPGVFDLMGSGLVAGTAGGLEALTGFGEMIGFDGPISDDVQEYLRGVQQTYKPPEHIQESLSTNPWLLADPDWWLYNVPMAAGSMLPAMGISAAAAAAAPAVAGAGLVAGTAARFAGLAGRLSPHIGRTAASVTGTAAKYGLNTRTTTAGAINMMTVGGGVYNEALEDALKRGLSPEEAHAEAASKGWTATVVDAPFAFLESVALLNPKVFSRAVDSAADMIIGKGVKEGISAAMKTRKGKTLTAAAVEGIQESGENIFAQNLVLGKPWNEGVAEGAILGTVMGAGIGGGGQYLQHRRDNNGQPDPAEGHIVPPHQAAAMLLETARITDPQRMLGDGRGGRPPMDDPRVYPTRVALFESLAQLSRERIETSLAEAGLPPMEDAEWISYLSNNLRLIGVSEVDLDGRTIEELETMVNAASARMQVAATEEESAPRDFDEAQPGLGDTFVIEGEEETTYTVTNIGVTGPEFEALENKQDAIKEPFKYFNGVSAVNTETGEVVEFPQGYDRKIRIATRSIISGVNGVRDLGLVSAGDLSRVGEGIVPPDMIYRYGRFGSDPTPTEILSDMDALGIPVSPEVESLLLQPEDMRSLDPQERANDRQQLAMDAAIPMIRNALGLDPETGMSPTPRDLRLEAPQEGRVFEAQTSRQDPTTGRFQRGGVLEPQATIVEPPPFVPGGTTLTGAAEPRQMDPRTGEYVAPEPEPEPEPVAPFIPDPAPDPATQGEFDVGRLESLAEEELTRTPSGMEFTLDQMRVREKYTQVPTKGYLEKLKLKGIREDAELLGVELTSKRRLDAYKELQEKVGLDPKTGSEVRPTREGTPLTKPTYESGQVQEVEAGPDKLKGRERFQETKRRELEELVDEDAAEEVEVPFLPDTAVEALEGVGELDALLAGEWPSDPNDVDRIYQEAELEQILPLRTVAQIREDAETLEVNIEGAPKNIRKKELLRRVIAAARARSPFEPITEEDEQRLQTTKDHLERISVENKERREGNTEVAQESYNNLSEEDQNSVADLTGEYENLAPQNDPFGDYSMTLGDPLADAMLDLGLPLDLDGPVQGSGDLSNVAEYTPDEGDIAAAQEILGGQRLEDTNLGLDEEMLSEPTTEEGPTEEQPPAPVEAPPEVVDDLPPAGRKMSDKQRKTIEGILKRKQYGDLFDDWRDRIKSVLAKPVGFDSREASKTIALLLERIEGWERAEGRVGVVRGGDVLWTAKPTVANVKHLLDNAAVVANLSPEAKQRLLDGVEKAGGPDASNRIVESEVNRRRKSISRKTLREMKKTGSLFMLTEDGTRADITSISGDVITAKLPTRSRLRIKARDLEHFSTEFEGSDRPIHYFRKKVRNPGKLSKEEFEDIQAALGNAKHPDTVNKKGVKDNWSDMRSRIRNQLGRPDDKEGIYRLARDMGITARATDDVPTNLRKIFNKTRPASGDMHAKKTSMGDRLIEYARSNGETSILGAPPARRQSGFILPDGTYIALPSRPEGWSFNALKAAGFRNATAVAQDQGASHTFMERTGAIRVFQSGTGNFDELAMDAVYAPTANQTRLMRELARSGAYSGWSMAVSGSGVADGQPRATQFEIMGDIDQRSASAAEVLALIQKFFMKTLGSYGTHNQAPRANDLAPDLTLLRDEDAIPDRFDVPEEVAREYARMYAPAEMGPLEATQWARIELLNSQDVLSGLVEKLERTGAIELVRADIEALAAEGVRVGGQSYSRDTDTVIETILDFEIAQEPDDYANWAAASVSSTILNTKIAEATTHVRELVREGNGGQLEYMARRIKSSAESGNKLAISVLYAIDVLRERNIHAPGFMPMTEDIGRTREKPPWDEPLAPNLEAQAEVLLRPPSGRDFYYGLAGEDVYDQSSRITTIEQAREAVWERNYGDVAEFIKVGVMNDLTVAEMFKANGDDYARNISSKGRRTLAGRIRGIFKKEGTVNWRDVKLSKKDPLGDIALMGQVIKDPRIEQNVLVYLDENNTVVGRPEVVSSRRTGSTITESAFGWDNIAASAASLGATKVVSMHNHPSGNPTPSPQDLSNVPQSAEAAAKVGLEYVGHVVIDQTDFSVISPNGEHETIPLPKGYHRRYVKGGWTDSDMLDPLTTPGAEAEAEMVDRDPVSGEKVTLERARYLVYKTRDHRGDPISQEDRAQYLAMLQEDSEYHLAFGAGEDIPQNIIKGIVSANDAEILTIASDLAHETKKLVVVQSEDTLVLSVELVDPKLLENPNEFGETLQMLGSTVNVYITKELADTAILEQDSDGNPMDAITVSDLMDRFRGQGIIDNFVEGAEVSKYHTGPNTWTEEDTGEDNRIPLRDIYLNNDDETRESILFMVGKNPSLTQRELQGENGLISRWSEAKKEYDKYKDDNQQALIDHFVGEGGRVFQKWKILPPLEPGMSTVPSELPWRQLSESARIARDQQLGRYGSDAPDAGKADDMSLGAGGFSSVRFIDNILDEGRGKPAPATETEPNTQIIDDHMMGGSDHGHEQTEYLNALADSDTLEAKMKRRHNIREWREMWTELVRGFRRGREVGWKRGISEAFHSINAYAAIWAYDTNLALKNYLRMLNERRAKAGLEPLAGTTDFVEEFQLANSYQAQSEHFIKRLVGIWDSFGKVDKNGDPLGLTDQEQREVSRYINAKTAVRRIRIARNRHSVFVKTREDLLSRRAALRGLKARQKRGGLSKAEAETLRDEITVAEEEVRHLRARFKLQRKTVIEEVVRDENGKPTGERRFNPALINPGGITEVQAVNALRELEARVGAENYAKLEAMEGKLGEFWEDMLDHSVDAGVISQEDRAGMMNANDSAHQLYLTPIDVIRHHNNKLRRTGRVRGGMNISDPKIYEAMAGTKSDSRDPLAASMDRVIAVTKVAARNKAVKALHEGSYIWAKEGDVATEESTITKEFLEDASTLVREADTDQPVEPDYSRIDYWRDGKRVTLDVFSPIADSVNNVNRPQMSFAMSLWRKATHWLRTGATTLSPSFIVWNIPRDLYTQWINAENPISVRKDWRLLLDSYGMALRSATGRGTSPLFEAYQRFGAQFGSQIQAELDPTMDDKRLRQILGRRTFLGAQVYKEGRRSSMNWFLGKMDATKRALLPTAGSMTIAEAFEQGTRLAVHRKQIEAETGIDTIAHRDRNIEQILENTKGWGGPENKAKRDNAIRKAIFAGRRGTVDFSEGGKTFLWINMMAPFSNAPIAAAHATLRGIKKQPSRALWFASYGMMTTTVLSLMNRMMWGDLLDEVEDHDRFGNFNLIVDKYQDENGKWKPVTLSMPKGDYLNGLLAPIEKFVDHLWRAKEDENYGLFADMSGSALLFDHLVQLMSDLSPVDFARDGDINPMLITKYAPVPLRQYFELTSDKNFYFDREIEGNLRDLLPEDRIRRDTSEGAVVLSQIAGSVYDVFGSREDNPFSPVRVQHLAKGMFAEAGDISLRLFGAAAGSSDATYFRNSTYNLIGDTTKLDVLEAFARAPIFKKFLSVGGRNEERSILADLEAADRVMGSRRIRALRPVRQLVSSYKRGRLTREMFEDEAFSMSAEQQHMLMGEMDREARGVGSGGYIARFISSMGIRDFSRAVGIVNVMNNTITSAEDRLHLLRTLAHSKLLTPMVLSQLMLLSGHGAIKMPEASGVLAVRGLGSGGLARLATPGALPFLPETRGRRRVGRGLSGGGLSGGGF